MIVSPIQRPKPFRMASLFSNFAESPRPRPVGVFVTMVTPLDRSESKNAIAFCDHGRLPNARISP